MIEEEEEDGASVVAAWHEWHWRVDKRSERVAELWLLFVAARQRDRYLRQGDKPRDNSKRKNESALSMPRRVQECRTAEETIWLRHSRLGESADEEER
jgi:hypothetical protein